jgi:hypothetical protein
MKKTAIILEDYADYDEQILSHLYSSNFNYSIFISLPYNKIQFDLLRNEIYFYNKKY